MLRFTTRNIKKPLRAFIFLCFTVACAHAQNLNNPNNLGPMGTQVNTLSGNLFLPRTEFIIPARGLDIMIAFSYNSFNYDENHGYGNGWAFNYGMRYTIDTTGVVTIYHEDDREDVYTPAGSGAYKSSVGIFDVLTEYASGKYLLATKTGMKYFFDNAANRRLTKMTEPNGNYVSFGYKDSLISSVTNAAGQTITLNYTDGLLTSVVDALVSPTRTFTYKYDGYKNLVKVTDPLGNSIQYGYLLNGPMNEITDKNSNVANIIYYPDYTISELIDCNSRKSFSYDTILNITTVTDYVPTSTNQVTTYTYKKFNGIAWITSIAGNCCGFNMKFEFDAQGNKVKQTDANGNIYTYTYDANGNMLSTTDPLNQTTTYTYSANLNRLTSRTDPKGNTTTIAYDNKGNITKITEPGNHVSTAEYTANGDLSNTADAKGNIYKYSYDAYGNINKLVKPNGYTAGMTYDARGNALSYTNAFNNTFKSEYDVLNRRKKMIDPANNSVQFTYDAVNNVTSITNEKNDTRLFNYDASNRLTGYTDAIGNKIQLVYDAMNNITGVRGPLNEILSFSYDNLNRLTGKTDPLNNSSSYTYDANGNIVSITTPNGQSANFTYDAANRLTSIKDAKGIVITYTYDKNGNSISYTNGNGATLSAEYDELNRTKKIIDALGNSAVLNYDKNNNIISATDRNGNTEYYAYDSLNRVKTYTDNNGFSITAIYDALNNVAAIKDQNGQVTNYTYNKFSKLETISYPDGKKIKLDYDVKGNIITKYLSDGSTISFEYDKLNRLTSKKLPDGQVYSYTYDANDRLLSATNKNGTVTLKYDGLDRITSETYNGLSVNYNYDVAGRTQTMIYPDSSIITKKFDERNRLLSIEKNYEKLVAYEYDNVNNLVKKSFKNGVITNMRYDLNNRLTNISTSDGNIQDLGFTYDNEMNKLSVIRVNDSASSEQFKYDKGYRLIDYTKGFPGKAATIHNIYSYDAVGNRTEANINGTTITYTTNNLNQLIKIVSDSKTTGLTYDADGNLLSNGLVFKTYDAERRLIKDSLSSANVVTYQYDPFGRRTKKTINGISLAYTFSGANAIEERNATNNSLINSTVFRSYLKPEMNEKKNTQYFYHQNELGSVEALSNSAGNIAESYQYDVYGRPSVYDSANNIITASKTGNRFGFTGQEYDTATGDYHFFFRDYSPETGTFNERDLIGYGDGMGMYQYVGNNPANGVDVFGLDALERDPCPHDPKKIKFITDNEVKRTKQYMIDYQQSTFPEYDYNSNLQAIGSADSRYYDGLSKSQFPSAQTIDGHTYEQYYFKGSTYHNYEVNYYFTGYASGYRGFGGSFSQGTSRLWNGLKGGMEMWDGNYKEGAGRALSAFNPWDTRASLAHTGNLDARNETGQLIDNDFLSGTRDVLTGGAFADLFNTTLVDHRHTEQEYSSLGSRFDNETTEFGEWWPVINPETGEMGYEFFANRNIPHERMKEFEDFVKQNCPHNNKKNNNGTKKPKPPKPNNIIDLLKQIITEVISSLDPNEIIGPDGVGKPKWVALNSPMPYTILFENSTAASAPAKLVKVVYPIDPKQDMNGFSLGSFGFNNFTFNVQPNTSSFYQRLNLVDSMGLYVDVTAGLDVIKHQIFWTFQSIDPVTQLPPTDPLKGFLKLRDSSDATAGHGFVNFSIRPLATAKTGDTTHATADILFDLNDTIPTNVAKNTIDAVAPISHIDKLPATTDNRLVSLSWSGADDAKGSGLKNYTLYVSVNNGDYSIYKAGITRTDTIFNGDYNNTYRFFVLATDSAGNTEILRKNEETTINITGGALPLKWLYFTAAQQGEDALLNWATAAEINTKHFEAERATDGKSFTMLGIINAANNGAVNKYKYIDKNIIALNAPVLYYRVKQVDEDGSFTYSNIIAINIQVQTLSPMVKTYPNPFRQTLNLMIANVSTVDKDDHAEIYNMDGKLMYRKQLNQRLINETITLQDLPQLNKGVYVLKVMLNKKTYSFKIVKGE